MISERVSDDIPLHMVIPILMHFCSFISNFWHRKPYKAARHPRICDVINDVKLFSTVYRRIYCRKFLTLSNQTSRFKIKCIRIVVYLFYCMALFHSQIRRHIMINFDMLNFKTCWKTLTIQKRLTVSSQGFVLLLFYISLMRR